MAMSTMSRFFACGRIRATCSSKNLSVLSDVLSRVSARNSSDTFRWSLEDSHPMLVSKVGLEKREEDSQDLQRSGSAASDA
jgi:hypothetical protein